LASPRDVRRTKKTPQVGKERKKKKKAVARLRKYRARREGNSREIEETTAYYDREIA